MSDSSIPPQSSDDLQFDVAEVSESSSSQIAGKGCAFCHKTIESIYYALKDKLLCPECHAQVVKLAAGSGFSGFAKASLLGLGTGLVAALIWGAIRAVTHYEIGLVAVVVGYMVGKAVRKGAGGWGGREYQFLAVLITYLAIAATFIPIVVDARAVAAPLPDKVLFCLQAPVIIGSHDLIMAIIYGIALWEAWKFTARRALPITGPFHIGPHQQLEATVFTTADPPAACSGDGGSIG